MTKWAALAAILCGMNVLYSCQQTKHEHPVTEVVSTELLRTTQSWNGADLPDYPQGSPELVAVKYVIPISVRLGLHISPLPILESLADNPAILPHSNSALYGAIQ